jgi:hypothetical protein
MGALYASMATAAAAFQAALAAKRGASAGPPQAAAMKLAVVPHNDGAPLEAAPPVVQNPFAAAAGVAFQPAGAPGPKAVAAPQGMPLRRPDLGRSVRGTSVRRGSKASTADGTKLRGVDIRLAAAAALSSQMGAEGAGQPSPVSVPGACAAEPSAGAQSPPAKASPLGAPTLCALSGGARRLMVVSPFRDAEEPIDGFALGGGGGCAEALPQPIRGAKSSPVAVPDSLHDISRSHSAASSFTSSTRNGRTTATLVRRTPAAPPPPPLVTHDTSKTRHCVWLCGSTEDSPPSACSGWVRSGRGLCDGGFVIRLAFARSCAHSLGPSLGRGALKLSSLGL